MKPSPRAVRSRLARPSPTVLGRHLIRKLVTAGETAGNLTEFMALVTATLGRGLGARVVEFGLVRGNRLYRLVRDGCRRDGAITVEPLAALRSAATAAARETSLELRVNRRRLGFVRVQPLPASRAAARELTEWLVLAITLYRAAAAARERVKELACINAIACLSMDAHLTTERLLQEVARALPPAWHYANGTGARVVLDGQVVVSPGFQPGAQRQQAHLVVKGGVRGRLEVHYTVPRIELDEGPFLREERQLLETVARQVALIIEQREGAVEELAFRDQIRHADRLATIGQLAAGVAHELNEPLGKILGFAQLAQREVPGETQPGRDLERIVAATIHARQIIKNLLMFARQMPARKEAVDLNRLIREELVFFEQVAANQQVHIVRRLDPALLPFLADPVQIKQVLVNLVVNAIQAMPNGGRLTIATVRHPGGLRLLVTDTGVGIPSEIIDRIFEPFVTTKEMGKGTGLGLPVTHGIVTGHGGTISVTSRPGNGTRFALWFPGDLAEGAAAGADHG